MNENSTLLEFEICYGHLYIDFENEIYLDLALKFFDLLNGNGKVENLKGYEYKCEYEGYRVSGKNEKFSVFMLDYYVYVRIKREEFSDFDKVVEMIKRIAYAMNIFKLYDV